MQGKQSFTILSSISYKNIDLGKWHISKQHQGRQRNNNIAKRRQDVLKLQMSVCIAWLTSPKPARVTIQVCLMPRFSAKCRK